MTDTSVSAVASAFFDGINAARSSEQLDGLARELWRQYRDGRLAEEEATLLIDAIANRRPISSNAYKAATATHKLPLARQARIGTRFRPRQRPRSPNRKASRDRRRRLGGSSALPDTLRQFHTEGQRAVLCIIAGEIKRHGVCDLPIDKMAALSGVCRTTVQTTLHEARRLGHLQITERPVPGRKNLSNLVDITSPEWRKWTKGRAYRTDR
jgi:hypothetical protein